MTNYVTTKGGICHGSHTLLWSKGVSVAVEMIVVVDMANMASSRGVNIGGHHCLHVCFLLLLLQNTLAF